MLEQQVLNGLVIGSIYTLIALGFTIVFGIFTMLNFAHGELYMLGGYLTLLLSQGLRLPFLISILGAMTLTAVAGAFIELVGFRPLRSAPIIATMISTLGISLLMQNGALLAWGPDARPIEAPYSGIRVAFFGISSDLQRLMVIPVTIFLIIILTFVIQRTKLGRAMRACAQDIQAAGWMGVNINTVATVTFAIAAALAAAAGALIGPIFMVEPYMGFSAIMKSFVVVILGGVGNVPGAIVGGYFLGLAEALVAGYISTDYQEAIAFFILIMVLLVKPSGLFGKYVPERV